MFLTFLQRGGSWSATAVAVNDSFVFTLWLCCCWLDVRIGIWPIKHKSPGLLAHRCRTTGWRRNRENSSTTAILYFIIVLIHFYSVLPFFSQNYSIFYLLLHSAFCVRWTVSAFHVLFLIICLLLLTLFAITVCLFMIYICVPHF